MAVCAISFSNKGAVLDAVYRAGTYLVPPPDMKPSEWAEANIVISVGNARPGPIRFDNAPPQRGMIDVIKEQGIRRVSYMLPAQFGKTTIQQCIIGYFVAHEPKSQIFVQPTQGDVQTFQETKLRPMLEANKAISSKMAKQRGREGVNNSRIISYIGGWLMFSWAGSPKTLRGRSAPITHADEIDGMEKTAEGDPGELLAQRAASFGDEALRTESSTPTIKEISRIEKGFEEGDQRRYYVPCPHCDHPQHLKWENVTWQGRKSTCIDDAEEDLHNEHLPETAAYVCEACGVLWNDGERIAAIRTAVAKGFGWIASKPFRGHASFHATEMASVFRHMRHIVQSYLDKLVLGDLQSFINVSLALTYEEKGEKADPTGLMARAEEYRAEVPAGGLYLTAGIDMQMDRLEVEVVAWGIGEESWSVGYWVLWGDPLAGDVWTDLDDLLASTFQHESGAVLPISAALLDTGGTQGYTQAAYEYGKGKTGRRLFLGKGVGGWGRPIVEKPQRKQSGKNARKVDLFLVGVDEAKLIVMRRLTQEAKTGGYCHFPSDRDSEWYKQLTAEKLVTRYVKGQPIREWHKPDKARNEAFDCRVYALAALKIMQPSFKRLAERYAMDEESAETSVKTTQLTDLELNKPAKKPVRKVAENPQEEAKPTPPQTKPTIKRSKTATQARRGRNSWAKNW
jgi:phage terminase large subunit GpA-like protein